MIWLEHAVAVIEPWLVAYGVTALFITIYLESFGVPLPSESAILSASVLALRGDLSIVSVVGAAWLAAVLGDMTGYFIGRLGGRPLLKRFGPKMGLTEERFELLTGQMRRHGFVVVLFARFVWMLRQLNGVLAGTLSMPLTRFVSANLIGAGLWVVAWSLGPYLLADRLGVFSIVRSL